MHCGLQEREGLSSLTIGLPNAVRLPHIIHSLRKRAPLQHWVDRNKNVHTHTRTQTWWLLELCSNASETMIKHSSIGRHHRRWSLMYTDVTRHAFLLITCAVRAHVWQECLSKHTHTYTQKSSTAANEEPKGALAQQPIILSLWRNSLSMSMCVCVCVHVCVCRCFEPQPLCFSLCQYDKSNLHNLSALITSIDTAYEIFPPLMLKTCSVEPH